MTPMRGIDISNWQKGLKLAPLGVDFAIIKATEGLKYVDSTCNGFVEQAQKAGMKWGTYHFARNNTPEKEAEFYYQNIKNYVGKGIMVLDIEDDKIKDWGSYSDRFATRLHQLTGIYPLIYTSAANLHRFKGSAVTKTCGLWLAGYPRRYASYPNTAMPYKVYPWRFAAIWQCSDNGRFPSYNGAIDINIGYLTKEQWDAYAGQTSMAIDMTDYKQLAYDVLLGKYGNGNDRKAKLGDKYDKVQAYVNEIDALVGRVLKGELGNGSDRRANIERLGYSYSNVQNIVNKRLK